MLSLQSLLKGVFQRRYALQNVAVSSFQQLDLKCAMKMSTAKKRVIVDVDVGTDDALALLVLLHAEKNGLAKIEAINCSKGNASLKDVTRNVIRLLEILDRTDIPVYKGATEALIPPETPIPQFHGKDGFGDLEHEKEPDVSIVQKDSASVAMRNLVINNPGQISLICIGPLTNIALTMKLFDDFAPNIKEIFIMGGNYAATGNVTETAEFNFYVDPEAAYIVLENAQCPLTIATWETCLNTHLTFRWRFDVLGSKNTPIMELLNRAEKSIYPEKENPPDSIWYPCDALCVIAMLYPNESITKQSKHNATVELHGSKTRGQIVLDHLKQKDPNVTMLEKINDEFIKEILLQAT
ncbi:hypothetical protein ILUMI_06265 [Ignelater luminosus]|uniref:Inosine/uridine-preferring nucleoside hydrolase domain-containing protein n=1 Tax=Ignelater luminosus TaxID=2038154 RepID=A0A8K0GHX4_IGNLU|nr:hypothetical protein ILUMI_06265 [Ignelater luminosus]